jgi:hypothetical protein
MRIAVVVILLAAAVPAWRARHRIVIPSGSSLSSTLNSILPAPPVAPPESPEAAATGSPKTDAHPAEVAARTASAAATGATASAREYRAAPQTSPDVAALPIIEPTPSAEPVSATPAIPSPVVETAAADEPVPHSVRVEVELLEAKIFPPSPPPATARASNAVSTNAAHVYGDADSNVTPPEVIGGKKELGGIVGAIEPGTTVTIEFVVNELGLVETAKGLKEPRTVGESLLLAMGLHAIKSWRFRPAQKDGEPVSYRKWMSFGAY